MVRIAATIMMAASTKALTRASFNRLTPTALLGSLLGANGDKYAGAVMGTEDIMKPKAHGMPTACICVTFGRVGGSIVESGGARARAGRRACALARRWRPEGAPHSTPSPRRRHRDASDASRRRVDAPTE